MTGYKLYFRGKKITIMGLGLLGRGIGYTKFLAECGAILTVTDLKTKEQLAPSVKALSKYKNIKFVLGHHDLKDFKNTDMIIKAAGVPLDSIYINEAQKNNIPIEMDASLFAEHAPGVTIIGVTGTRGKSMTTMLAYEILKSNETFLKRKVYLGGNIRGFATLPLLKKVKKGDIVVLELDSWQLQGFGEAKISPQISVFTTFMPDHMNYYKDNMNAYFADKANIFKYQKKGDTLIIRPMMKKLIPKNVKSVVLIANKKDFENFKFIVPGEHQKENLACAVIVAQQLGIPISKIKSAVKNFKGIEGRLQYVKAVDGVKIYNDNNATTPEAVIACLEALGSKKKNVVLIAGGADKGLELKSLVRAMNTYCKSAILLKGTGTTKLITNYKLLITNEIADSLKDAIKTAFEKAAKGDILVLSPGFASFGMFTNEYDRNDQYMKLVKKLK
jgi:UDP-N-acetylmuramoylalanine--D-glutamate ligase